MSSVIARILLSIALLAQGAGAIAGEIHALLHPHCHMAGSDSGAPGKKACCGGDACTMPECSDVCAGAQAFVAMSVGQPVIRSVPVAQSPFVAAQASSPHPSPPLRPPIV